MSFKSRHICFKKAQYIFLQPCQSVHYEKNAFFISCALLFVRCMMRFKQNRYVSSSLRNLDNDGFKVSDIHFLLKFTTSYCPIW